MSKTADLVSFYEGGGAPICSMVCWLSSANRTLTRDECFKNFSQHFVTHCIQRWRKRN